MINKLKSFGKCLNQHYDQRTFLASIKGRPALEVVTILGFLLSFMMPLGPAVSAEELGLGSLAVPRKDV